MDQRKIGAFLKGLRKEKGLTQEQFSEIVHVSNRTVSRWENGNHLPDLDILLEIADFYEVDLREILNGERKSTDVNKDVEETAIQTAEYASAQTERYNKTVRLIFVISASLWLLSQLIGHTGLAEIGALQAVSDFYEGAATGMLLVGLIITGMYGSKISAFKQRLLKRKEKK